MIGASAPDPMALDVVLVSGTLVPLSVNLDAKTLRTPRLNSGESTGVLICAGQSNICNTVDAAYTATNASKIDCLNVYDGAVYAGTDPLLGCSQLIGNTMTRLADKLITAGKYQRVILVPVGIGGTLVADWASTWYKRIIVAHRRCRAVGLTPTAVLWHQGESDTLAGTLQATYQASMTSIISQVRAAGFLTPWMVAQASYTISTTSAAVIAAQAAVVDGSTIFAGPNTDTLGSSYRQSDNVHFSSTSGADAAAALWQTAVAAHL